MDKETFFSCIKESMPNYADITDANITAGYDFHVSWLLHDDASRPNKKSKTILVSMDEETISDMEALNKEQTSVAVARLNKWLQTMLSQHDPSNNNQKEIEPPLVHWVVRYSDIVG